MKSLKKGFKISYDLKVRLMIRGRKHFGASFFLKERKRTAAWQRKDCAVRPDDKIDAIKGVGEKTTALFKRLNINTVGDLITYYPRDYETFEMPKYISQVKTPGVYALEVVVSNVKEFKKGRLSIISAVLSDTTGSMEVTWFNQPYLKNQLIPAYHFIFRGRVNKKGRKYVMEQPKFYKREQYLLLTRTLTPRYQLTANLSNNLVQKAVKSALTLADEIEESIPKQIKKKYNILKKSACLTEVHFPKDMDTLKEARRSLAFEEFYVYFLMLKDIASKKGRIESSFVVSDMSSEVEFVNSLPFSLTSDQKKVIDEIKGDLKSGYAMSRMVQGDVGSGKTVVAAFALLMMAKSGIQSCMMAPTEVLAKQHYETLNRLFSSFGIKIALLTGSLTVKERKGVLEKIENGDAMVVVGTHALITGDVKYHNLGLVITDEQHRFGVSQREKLFEKGKTPHVLVMSATPIPRTLALMVYGDMDISTIKQLPSERIRIKSCVVNEDYREASFKHIEKELESGHQIYVICPLVQMDEESSLKSVEEEYELFRERFEKYGVLKLHGRMKQDEKDSVMKAFEEKKAGILVSTTVIEVGINIPNATVILIEDADRYGLATLHQLRGRVGRGSAQSYCIYMTGRDDENTLKRLNILTESEDGFKIAERDLELRGPGDIFGFRQSGERNFKIGDIYSDAEVMALAIEAAKETSETERNKILTDLSQNGGNSLFAFFSV